jgi:hypothetical protein
MLIQSILVCQYCLTQNIISMLSYTHHTYITGHSNKSIDEILAQRTVDTPAAEIIYLRLPSE